MSSRQYLIGELAARAGVSVRTIRYYISEGLLPPPQTRGRYSVYDEDYLQRIRLIRRLKDAYLPIKEIRYMLETRTEEELEDFVQHYESKLGPGGDALAYISGVLERRPDAQSRDGLASRSRASAAVRSQPVDNARAGSDVMPDGAGWRRFVIADGLELHVSEPVLAQFGRAVRQLVRDGQEMLRRGGQAR
jgi:DNA-binding transcriptional MerR regulator